MITSALNDFVVYENRREWKNYDARTSSLALYVARTNPSVRSVVGLTVSGLIIDSWMDGRQPTGSRRLRRPEGALLTLRQ